MLLEELTALARETAADKRRELLRRVSDLMIDNLDACTDRDLVLFDEVLSRVLDSVGADARAEFSARVAGEAEAPRGVIMRLARDEDEDVAAPVLEHSPVLSDEDLAQVAEVRGERHQVAIARRRSLAEAVTEVLVRRGSKLVVHTVTGNRGARFSRTSFDELARRAQTDRTLQMRLVARPDLPPEVVDVIVPILSEELVTRLMAEGYEVGHRLPSDIVVKLRRRLGAVLAVKDVETRQVSRIAEDVRAGRKTLSDAVIDLAQHDRLADIADLVAPFADVASPQLLAALVGKPVEPLVILMRAVDLDARAFEAVQLMRARRLRSPEPCDAAMLARFLALEPETAQRALRFHKIRTATASATAGTAAPLTPAA